MNYEETEQAKKMTRDDYIVEDYASGLEIPEIARGQGLTSRRVTQILAEKGVELRPRRSRFEQRPLSARHERIGKLIYDHRFDLGEERIDAANRIGWSVHQLKKAEAGLKELELLDLLDIATYTGKTIEEVINGS